jgi:[FeFe] hydrogenase H-cluster maturation GTPase HydF
MNKTPKALRLQIGLFGRTNVGKSSFLNMIAGQDIALVSPVPGTTTDVVKKAMELLPLGPVVFLDTAGIDDTSNLSELRIERTKKIFNRADIAVIICEPNIWTEFETEIIDESSKRKTPCIIIVNKTDIETPTPDYLEFLKSRAKYVITCSSTDLMNRDRYINAFKEALIRECPDDFINPPAIIGDLLPPAGIAVLIIPIDLQAPKGRLILPQVQTIRDLLDNDATAVVVKEREYANLLTQLKQSPDVVVCDSQVVLKMIADTPPQIKCTTFSILFARYKGDLIEEARGAAVIERLEPDDKVLIAEACTHHALEDDIGRVKIPRWLRQYVGGDLRIDTCAGSDFPDNLTDYKLIIHCGACMLTRREMLFRIHKAVEKGIPITNYGLSISVVQGVLERVLSPFPAALEAYKKARQGI